MKKLKKSVPRLLLSLSLIFSFQALVFSSRAFAATAPPYTVSRYVSNPSNAYNWGVSAAQAAVNNKQSNILVILDFGQPQTWTSNGTTVYGTYDFADQKISTSQIESAVESFLSGFWNNTPVNGPSVNVPESVT